MRAEGIEVISLAQGVSSFTPPLSALKTVTQSFYNNKTHLYSHDAGLLSTREALSKYLQFKNLNVDPEREILLTAGASQAFFSALMTVGRRGAKVILPSPYYFDHQFAVLATGMIPVEVPMKIKDNKWTFDIEMMKKALDDGCEIVSLVSPNNPTGAVIAPSELEELLEAVVKNDGVIISDETYDRFVYSPSEFVSPAALPDGQEHVIVIGSFSKSLALAGWRIGYLTAPSYVIDEALKLQDTLVICAPVVSQIALEAALNSDGEDLILKSLKEFEKRKDVLCNILSLVKGLDWYEPEGSFFAFLKINPTSLGGNKPFDDNNFVYDLLEKTGVAVMAGSACGIGGKGHIRISFGNVEIPQLTLAAQRIASYMDEIVR